jgi:selenocysteine-specific elongation factor
VRLRVLGPESIAPGATGLVRLHLAASLPLVMGDRFVLRESGRDETVGGGEVLDVAPVLPASKARPTAEIDRVVAEHGWVTTDDLEALTGAVRRPTLGNWVVDPDALVATRASVHARIAAADDLGLDIATLDTRERATLSLLDDVQVDAGRARPMAAHDPFVDHPFLSVLAEAGVTPPDPTDVDRAELRELVRRKLVVDIEGIPFHPSAIDRAALVAAELLRAAPDGFTMSQFREALGATRKHSVPLGTELDRRGITRRRGDVRIAGPRLPQV